MTALDRFLAAHPELTASQRGLLRAYDATVSPRSNTGKAQLATVRGRTDRPTTHPASIATAESTDPTGVIAGC